MSFNHIELGKVVNDITEVHAVFRGNKKLEVVESGQDRYI